MNIEKKGIVRSDNLAEYVEKGREATQHNREEIQKCDYCGSSLNDVWHNVGCMRNIKLNEMVAQAQAQGAAKLAEELLGSECMETLRNGTKVDWEEYPVSQDGADGYNAATEAIKAKIKELTG